MAELLFREDPYLKGCEATVVAVHENAVELDRTVFYPLGGGQAGDTGKVGNWRVLDTRKGEAADSVLHLLDPEAKPEVGMKLAISIDWERRHRLMRLHTALLLLGAVVKAPVTGGRIGDDKAHLDFDIEMEKLVKSLPRSWEEESSWRYNVIFLRHTIDSEKILAELPAKSDIEEIVYRPGVLLWSAQISELNRRNMLKLLSRKIFQDMTVRNLNTTKKLYDLMKKVDETNS